MAKLLRASFGGIELLVESFSGDAGRDWAVQSPNRGDEHPVQDQGRRLRRTPCSLRFVDLPGVEGDYAERYLAFEALANEGRPQIFLHPLHGSYLAVVEELNHEVDAESHEIAASCTFLAVQEPKAVQSLGAGVSAFAGPEEVGVDAAVATAELAALGEPSDVPASCLSRVEGWASGDDADARSVLLEVGSLASQIDAEVERLDLLSSYDRWAAYKALVRLRYSVTRAATAATAATSRVVEYTVGAATPLRALCARIYGATDAQERADQITRLNGLRTPGLVPAGTVLRVPSEGMRG